MADKLDRDELALRLYTAFKEQADAVTFVQEADTRTVLDGRVMLDGRFDLMKVAEGLVERYGGER